MTTVIDSRTDLTVVVGAAPLRPEDVVAVARHDARVELDAAALARVAASRALVEGLADDPEPHYGISTGLRRARDDLHRRPSGGAQLQASLIRSHAAGTGAEVEREVVRALQLLRLQTLATGHTGVRPVVVETYAAHAQRRASPRSCASTARSAARATSPRSSHVALAAMGEGDVRDAAGELRPGRRRARRGRHRAARAAREGGPRPHQRHRRHARDAAARAPRPRRCCCTTADVAAAMSIESQLGTDAVFAADLMALRPQVGQAASAANLRAFLAGSPIVAIHRDPAVCTRVQDAYSLRCSPQVHGAARDTVDYAAHDRRRASSPSAVDNPVITDDGRVESNGNFHGAPVAYVLDFLAIAVADVASISERRTDRALDQTRSHGLPPFLAARGRRRLRAHDRAVRRGRASSPSSSASRCRHPSTRSRRPRCRRTTSRWAGPPPASCAAASTGSRRVLAIEVAHRRPRARPARAAAARRRRPAPCATSSAPSPRGPGHDHFLSPDIEAVTDARAVAGAVARVAASAPTRSTAHDRPQTRHRPSAPRAATSRTAKSWGAEAAKRMLMNNLDPEVAEHPEDLVVYGGTGKAARSWEAYDAIVRTLDELEPDETLLVQSGKPVGVFRTHEWAPRVLIANSNLVGDWATWPEFRRLEDLGLTMYGQMTAGSWIYIGTQGILQGTYETFAAVARSLGRRRPRRHPDADRRMRRHGRRAAAGRHAQRRRGADRRRRRVAPRAPRRARLPRRVHDRPRRGRRARRRRARTPARRSRSASSATPPRSSPSCCCAATPIDIVTDQTSAHDPLAYLPVGVDVDDWKAEAERDPEGFTVALARQHGHAGRRDGRIPGCRRRGLRLRQLDPRRGAARRLRPRVRVPRVSCRRTSGRSSPRAAGPFRWVALSGDPEDIRKTDAAVKALFPDERRAASAGSRRPARPCTSRVCPRASAGSATRSATSRA